MKLTEELSKLVFTWKNPLRSKQTDPFKQDKLDYADLLEDALASIKDNNQQANDKKLFAFCMTLIKYRIKEVNCKHWKEDRISTTLMNILRDYYYQGKPQENIQWNKKNPSSLERLPLDVFKRILLKIGPYDAARLSQVSKNLYRLSGNDEVWKVFLEDACLNPNFKSFLRTEEGKQNLPKILNRSLFFKIHKLCVMQKAAFNFFNPFDRQYNIYEKKGTMGGIVKSLLK